MKRKGGSLGPSLERSLNMYALAAGAAGVSVLALARPAEAKIVYTRIRQVIPPGTMYALSFDRTTDFTLTNNAGHAGRTSVWYSSFGQRAARGNGAVGYALRYCRLYSALQPGANIGPGAHFLAGGAWLVALQYVPGDESVCGLWYNVTNRYLGLRFKIKGKTHYGWALLNVQINYGITAALTGYAYETIPNKPIIAGKTHGKDVVTLQPASLGHLARGASAIPASRGEQ